MSKYNKFSDEELKCRCGCGLGAEDMNEDFMGKLVWIRIKSGIIMPVSSAIRCKKHNKIVSSTGENGPHTTGHAVDIKRYGAEALEILKHATQAGITGIGVSQKGAVSGRFIHLDDLESTIGRTRPAIWSY